MDDPRIWSLLKVRGVAHLTMLGPRGCIMPKVSKWLKTGFSSSSPLDKTTESNCARPLRPGAEGYMPLADSYLHIAISVLWDSATREEATKSWLLVYIYVRGYAGMQAAAWRPLSNLDSISKQSNDFALEKYSKLTLQNRQVGSPPYS